MTIPKISQAANAAAERYFDMRKRVPHLADRSLAEVIQGAIDAQKEPLIAWIKQESDYHNTCTFSVLGEICDGCRCERGRK